MFLDHVTRDYCEALFMLLRRAEGDYSADEHPKQFPAYKPQKAAVRPWSLFEAWAKEAEPAASTKARWRSIFRTLDERFADANRISEEDARLWLKKIAEQSSAATAKKNWLAAIKTVFAWAIEQRLIAANPFASIKIKVPKKTKLREKAFTAEEARTILKACTTGQ
jgi:site-specific recombinase XerD